MTIAAVLASNPLPKGDRVAVLSQNNPEWCLTFWATVSQGAVLVGLNGADSSPPSWPKIWIEPWLAERMLPTWAPE